MPKVSLITLPATMVESQQQVVSKKSASRAISFRNKINKIIKIWMALLGKDDMLVSLLAFLLGRVLIIGECAPVGLAFFTAMAQLDEKRSFRVGLWAVVGVLSGGYYSEVGVYILAIGLYFLYADKIKYMKTRMNTVPLFMFLAVIGAGLVMNVFKEFTLYSVLLTVFEGTICTVLSYVFMYSVPMVQNGQWKHSSQTLKNEQLSCMAILAATAVAGLGDTMVLEYSMRNIAGSLLVMIVAFIGGSGLSAVVGVVVGLTVGLSDGNTTFAISLYGLAGVLSGAFFSLGKLVVMIGFILGSAISTLYFGQESDLIRTLSECVIAGGLFFLVPNCWLVKWRYLAQQAEENMNYTEQVNGIILKVNHVSEIFNDLASVFATHVAETQMKIQDDTLAKTLSAVGEQICEECERRSQCWEFDFYQTYNGILEMLGQVEVNQLCMGSMPPIFQKNCIKCKDLLETVKFISEHNRKLTFWQKQIIDNRQLVTEQMRAASEIISNLSYEIGKVEFSDEQLSLAFQEKTSILGCHLTSVRVTGKTGKGLIEAHKKPCNGNRECMNTILPLAAGLMKEKMTLRTKCGNEQNEKKCKLIMQVVPRFNIEFGMVSCAKDGQEVCGDSCTVLRLNKGKVALLISDGMGSGSPAAAQSAVAVKFLKKTLEAGFGIEVAIKIINGMLLLRSPEESFVTIDMAIIDTYSGEIEFLKIGSAPSFIKRVREVTTVKSATMPIGILQQIEIESVESIVVEGDFIVMVSDGIVDVPQSKLDKGNWLANFLRQSVPSKPQELANQILDQAKKMSGNRILDDMTVLVGKINREANGE